MTVSKYGFAIPRREAPEVCMNAVPRETREHGMPGARCTRGLVCKVVRRNAHEHTGSAEALRHSPRNGFTAYAVLSPENRALLSPSPHGNWHVGPVGLSAPPQDLTPTAEASGPHDFAVRRSAVRLRAQAIAHGSIKSALRSRVRAGTAASTAPRPNVHDDGQRPSCRGGMANHIG